MSVTLQNLSSSSLNLPSKSQSSTSKFEMREPPTTESAPIAYAIALLRHYNFELRGYTPEELVNIWLKKYQASWVRLGVIEALYQGRYKAVSVEQLLAVWGRRGQPIYRFNHEFERLISRKLPQNLTAPLHVAPIELSEEYNLPPVTYSVPEISKEAAIFEEVTEEEVPIIKQDTQLPVTTIRVDLSEAPRKSEDKFSEPLVNSTANSNYEADWSRCEVSKQPIHQFNPPPDSSGFCLKLKAVVDKQDEISGEVVTGENQEDELESPPSDSDLERT